jgi:AAA+ ATPase superfamily predicted ATPase
MSFPTIAPDPFFNRTAELAALDRAWTQRGAGGQITLLYGRRRLGKTYLLQRFFAGSDSEPQKPHCYFLAEQTTAAAHRNALATQLLDALPDAGVQAEELAVSWNALLRYVSARCRERSAREGRFGLILDEFPYLVDQSPELPSVLQSWWDREGLHSRLYVILCGSQLSAMAALGRESAPLYGRFNAGIMLLDPLQYEEVASFYADSPHYGIPEALLMYGILGGTPRYHALVDTSRPQAEEVVALLFQPRGVLENEVRFLLGSEQIRDPAPYNAVLGAIASGETQFGGIQQRTGAERGVLSFHLKTLLELGWIQREFPYGETSERRALYRLADPFLTFWYRFVAPLASALQFSNSQRVYADRVAPFLADYMGWNVFEAICQQWLQRHATERLGLTIRRMGRYWSRDGRTELDIVAELDGGMFLFGECKWSAQATIGLSVYAALKAKIQSLPDAKWRSGAACVLFAVGGFAPALRALANQPEERLYLVEGRDLLPLLARPSTS